MSSRRSGFPTALARLGRGDIDLVLLDLGLPDSQGLETLHTLQKAAADIPVVVMTGNDDQELSMAAVRDGAQDYSRQGPDERQAAHPRGAVCARAPEGGGCAAAERAQIPDARGGDPAEDFRQRPGLPLPFRQRKLRPRSRHQARGHRGQNGLRFSSEGTGRKIPRG